MGAPILILGAHFRRFRRKNGPNRTFRSAFFPPPMKAFQRVCVLGCGGDAAQFGVFKFPHGCMLFVQGHVDGRVVSLHAERYPSYYHENGALGGHEAEAERAGVAEAYIRALRGRGVELPTDKTAPELTRAVMSWLRVAEAYTGASPLALAWTGSVVLRAMPRFRFALQRTPETGTVMMTLEIARAVCTRFIENRTPVPAATKTGALLGSEVLNAISRIVNPKSKTWQEVRSNMGALLAQYEFKDVDLGKQIDRLIRVTDERIFPDTVRRCVLRARPRCALCASCLLERIPTRSTDEFDEKCNVRLEFIGLCRACVASPVRLRSWASAFTAELATDPPTEPSTEQPRALGEHVRLSSPEQLDHTELAPGPVYYALCRAIPAAYTSVWQRAARFVSAAERVLRGNKNKAGATTGMMLHLSADVVEIIIAHLRSGSDMMPPSRAQFASVRETRGAYTPTRQTYSPTSPRYSPAASPRHNTEKDYGDSDSSYASSDEDGADDDGEL